MAGVRIKAGTSAGPSPLTFGEPDDGGARSWRLDLCELDVPAPVTPGGLEPGYEYVVTAEAVRHFGASMLKKPMRIAVSGMSHFDVVQGLSGARRRLAMPYGYAESQEIVERDGRKVWVIGGTWWTNEEPAVSDWVVANAEELGGSWELSILLTDKQWRQEGKTRFIDGFAAKGLALLEADAAAYKDLTRLVYAEGLPGLRGMDDSQADGVVGEFEERLMAAAAAAGANWQCGADRHLSVMEDYSWDGTGAEDDIFEWAGWPDNPQPDKAKEGFLVYDASRPEDKGAYKLPFARIRSGRMVASHKGLMAAAGRLPQADISDAARKAAMGVMDAYRGEMTRMRGGMATAEAEPGRTDDMEAEELRKTLLEPLEAAVAEKAELKLTVAQAEAEIATAKALGFETVSALAEAYTALKADRDAVTAAGFASAGEMIAKHDELKTVADGLAEQAVADEKKRVEATAERLFVAQSPNVPADKHDALRLACQAQAESLTDEQVEVLATAGAAGAPDGRSEGRVEASAAGETRATRLALAINEAKGMSPAERKRHIQVALRGEES